MKHETEPFVISLAEAKWLAKALGSDKTRPALGMAAFSHWDGAAVIFATDTFRIHALRLGDAPDGYPLAPMTKAVRFHDSSRTTKLLDLRRVIHEAKYTKAKSVAIDPGLCEVQVGEADWTDGRWERVYAPVFPDGLGAYPQLVHVIPEAYRPVTEVWAINSRYLADATMLAREAGWRTLVWSGDDGKQPLVFQPTRERPRWMAVVMPMTFGGNREGEKR